MKSYSRIVQIAACVLMILLALPAVVAQGSLSISNASGQAAVKSQISSIVSAMNQERAISMALGSAQFQSYAHGHSVHFSSIFTTWTTSSDMRVSALTLDSVNVAYYYYSADGSSTNIVVSENPSLTQVTGVSARDSGPQHGYSTSANSHKSLNSTTPYTVPPTLQPLTASTTSVSISATSINDNYCRKFGLLIDQPLNYPDFWNSQPNSVIGIGCGTFSYSNSYSLGDGSHYLELGVSAWVGNWEAKITINSVLMSDTTININTHAHVPFAIDFSMSANPTSLGIPESSSGTSTITIASTNFGGTVGLSTQVPGVQGLSASMNPTGVTLTPGGTAKSTLTVSVGGKTPPGTYYVNVVGNDGSVSHVAQVAVTVQPCYAPQYYQGTWAGYEFKAQCNNQADPVYEATSTWTVPSSSEPYHTACNFYHCDIAVWAGLTAVPGGGGSGSSRYIVQAGTRSGTYCAFGGCSSFYESWYEFWPQPTQYCGAVAPGHVITTDIVNQAITGGSSAYWNVYVEDFGSGGGNPVYLCAIVGYGFGVSGPYYAQFIAERPQWSNCCSSYFARLPNFSTFTMSVDINQGNSATHIPGYTAYNSGWYNEWIMYNSDQNIGLSPVGIGNSFTVTYIDSNGT